MEFLGRVQQSFAPEDMNQSRLEEWLTMGPKGRHKVSGGEGKEKWTDGTMSASTRNKISQLASELSRTKDIYDNINSAATSKEIEIINVEDSYTHKDNLKDLLEEKQFVIIKEEIRTTEPEDLDKIEIPSGIKNESQLKMQLGRRISYVKKVEARRSIALEMTIGEVRDSAKYYRKHTSWGRYYELTESESKMKWDEAGLL